MDFRLKHMLESIFVCKHNPILAQKLETSVSKLCTDTEENANQLFYFYYKLFTQVTITYETH